MGDRIIRLNSALEGRYRIERELGEGGKANLADDLKQGRRVALNVLNPELAAVIEAETQPTKMEEVLSIAERQGIVLTLLSHGLWPDGTGTA